MKTKKVILPIFLALIIALSSFVLFACGKQTSSTNTYRIFSEVMNEMKQDRDTFSSTSASTTWDGNKYNGFVTNYKLNDVVWTAQVLKTQTDAEGNPVKDKNGNEIKIVEERKINYDQYAVLVASGLNYIDKYYVKLEKLDVRADFGSVDDSAKSMKSSYTKLKAEHQKYVDAKSTGAAVPLVNGFFYNYRLAIADFTNKVYNCVDKLMGFFNGRIDYAEKLEKDEMKGEALDFYLDLKYFDILKDFKEVYMNSCKGVVLESPYQTRVDTTFSKFVKDVLIKGKKTDLSVETTKTLMEFFDRLEGSSDDARQAANGFSIYEFVNNYDKNIVAYKKDNENASVYYSKISDYYYYSTSTLQRTCTYLKGIVVA